MFRCSILVGGVGFPPINRSIVIAQWALSREPHYVMALVRKKTHQSDHAVVEPLGNDGAQLSNGLWNARKIQIDSF